MSLSLTSCDTATGQGAGYGAAGGAILGGLIGGSTRTAAIGAAAGAATGALIGSQVDANNRDEYYYREHHRRDFPWARPSGRPGFVISPYAPYYEIDVRGIPHGSLVRDPSCGRLFVKP
ncbi:MAG: glycine zipper 2TM domain-containing protein [Verrucomicrobia bacterium]|nr:glycine zipper 2TM domain-containing protein [Verrucomicrobiota bacterium]